MMHDEQIEYDLQVEHYHRREILTMSATTQAP